MRWQGRRQSSNIEDRRGDGGFDGGGLGRARIPIGLPGGGIGRAGGGGIGIIVVALIIMVALGINPLDLLTGGSSTGPGISTSTRQPGTPAGNDEGRQFVATVLADTEDTWSGIFRQMGRQYPNPTLVLFNGATDSGCGQAASAMGPFYCPLDQKLYIDLSFFDALRTKFGSPGDFAQAYVLAHEVGHHVQNTLGILAPLDRQRERMSEAESNQLSVRIELQADCLAGVWAAHTQQEGLLEEGDIDEALTAAAAVGDDTLQRRTQGYVVPESFNHGTSAQRSTWFKRGFQGGTVDSCDTFNSRI